MFRPTLLVSAAACLGWSAATCAGVLVDRTVPSGTFFVHKPNALAIPGPQDWMPAGIAVGDFNNDGWPDIFWAAGGIDPDRLFINNGDGTFTNRAAQWGVAKIHAACGACAGDFDGDGWIDIYVTSFGLSTNNQGELGKNILYRNNGDNTFTDVAAQAGVNFTSTIFSNGYGCSFGDYDLDGDLDLCVTAWFAPSQGNRLFRNNGDGTFTNVSGTAVVFPPGTWGFQSRFADMDNDGWPDLLVSADFGTSRYYRNNGNGTFADLTVASGTGKDQNGMGQCIGDFDGDGMMDWYVTSIFLDTQQPQSGEGNKLYMNLGNHQFVEKSVPSLVADGGWGWGTVAVDLNHDTLPDIVEVNGRPGSAEFTGEQEYVWLNNGNGTFTECAISVGLTYKAEGKSLSTLDFDRDGAMDLAITFNAGENRLYRNQMADGNWIHLTFDTQNNPLLAPHGMNSRVEVTIGNKTLVTLVDSGPAFLSTSEICAHFGLGDAPVIDQLVIKWPRGYVTTLTDVAVNQHLIIDSPTLHDFNGDGTVDAGDLGMLLGQWGTVGLSSIRFADTNNDGFVDGADLAELLAAWTGR